VTLTIAPPDLQSSTASSAVVVLSNGGLAAYGVVDLVEEPMDYTPIARGRVAAPEFPEETTSEDFGTGPMGY
jgi:hypothetical protein